MSPTQHDKLIKLASGQIFEPWRDPFLEHSCYVQLPWVRIRVSNHGYKKIEIVKSGSFGESQPKSLSQPKWMAFLPWLRASIIKIFFNSCYMQTSAFLESMTMNLTHQHRWHSAAQIPLIKNAKNVCQGCTKLYQTATNLQRASTSAHWGDLV